VWVDAEHCFDAGYDMRLGVAMDRLPVVQPNAAEEALEMRTCWWWIPRQRWCRRRNGNAGMGAAGAGPQAAC